MDEPVPPNLIQRARSGDAGARDDLYLQLEGALRTYLDRQMGERLARAVSLSDLCQDTFMQALDALPVLREGASLEDFKALLYQHARWMVGKQVAKHGRFHGESAGGIEGPSAQRSLRSGLGGGLRSDGRSSGDVTRLDELAWLQELIERLPEPQAAVVRLRSQGASYEAIAAELGVSEATVRQRYARGARELKRLAGDA